MSNSLLASLRLIRSQNIGPKTFFSLIQKFGSADKALENIPEILAKSKRKITICSEADAQKEIDETKKLGISILAFDDDNYPDLLRQIYDPAPILFYRGNLDLLKKEGIGIVGTRNSSANGCAITRKLAAEIGEAGYVTISGLARGVDTEAHKHSLKTGTIAVVAGGLDSVYPPENAKLFNEIAEQGLIISENPIGTEPQARHFPQRNRIIAGLSVGLLVVEAARRSGSLITAEYAAKEGREVFAVPGSPLDPRCSGTNYLIKNGACLVEGVDDIINNLGKGMIPILKEAEFEYEEEVLSFDSDDAREKILAKLSSSPSPIDSIAQQTELPIAVVNEIILELELDGTLERSWGNVVSLRMSS